MKLKMISAALVAAIALSLYVAEQFSEEQPAPELIIELTPQRVERGRYLANNIYMCMDCHSQRQYTRFGHETVEGTLGKGGNLFGLKDAFPGDFYAQNITPYALRSWSNSEIYRAITKGINKDGERMYPIMPYVEYSRQDPNDIYDIIAYLRSLPPIKVDNPRGSSNLPIDFMIAPIELEVIASQKPNPNNPVAYGEYLVNAATCAGCHTPRDKRGAAIIGLEFAGGTPFYIPGGKVSSTNITPDLETGIGGWNKEFFVDRFKRFEDPENPINTTKVKPGEFNTAMPWRFYSKMSEAELEAIFAYLQTLEPVKNSVHRFTPVTQ